MNEFIKKATDFVQEHKKPLTIIGIGTGLLVAFIAGEKYYEYCIGDGFKKIDAAGLVDWKVPDGDGFKVVEAKELATYISEHQDELRKIKY